MIGAIVLLLFFAGVCSAMGSNDPKNDDSLNVEELPEDTQAPDQAPAAPAEQDSSCDVVREAFLTGTDAQVRAALQALVADRSADAQAREYAQKYLEEDNADLKSAHKSLIQMFCTT